MNQSFPRSQQGYRTVRYQTGSNPPCGVFSRNEVFRVSWTNFRQGVDLPNWKQLIASGQDATTAFSGFRQYVKFGGSGYALIRCTVPNCNFFGFDEASGDIVGIPTAHMGTSANAAVSLDMAKRLIIKRARNLIDPLQGGVVLGELAETLHMIKNPVNTLRKHVESYFTSLKKGRPKTRRARKKYLENTYLEATYGWLPLINDINGGLEALRLIQQRRPSKVKRIVATGKSEATAFGVETVVSMSGLGHLTYRDRTTRTITHRLSCGVLVKSYASDFSLPDSLGLYPDEWLPTAWELIPYSFLIDYFTNIGTIIDGWSLVNSRLAYTSCTQRTKDVTLRTEQNLRPETGFVGVLKESVLRPAEHGLVSISITRSKLPSIVPDLAFRLPGFGSMQSLNTAVLLLSKQGGVPRPYY